MCVHRNFYPLCGMFKLLIIGRDGSKMLDDGVSTVYHLCFFCGQIRLVSHLTWFSGILMMAYQILL